MHKVANELRCRSFGVFMCQECSVALRIRVRGRNFAEVSFSFLRKIRVKMKSFSHFYIRKNDVKMENAL